MSRNYILPTLGDSFGISVIEALFANLNVVSTINLGCAPYIDNLKSFKYIDLNVKSLTTYIKSIKSDEKKFKEPDGRATRRFLHQKLSIKKQSREYEKLIFDKRK